MSRFVKAEVQRLSISNGDWIEIRKDLNTGELKQLEAAGNGIPLRLADGSVYTPIDWAVYEVDRAAIFLLDWSIKGDDDKVVPLMVFNKELGRNIVDVTVLKALEPLSFAEINTAITEHVLRRSTEKNAERASLRKKNEGEPGATQISQ